VSDETLVKNIVCPRCQDEGRESIVIEAGSSQTLLSSPRVFDKQGNEINSHANTRTTRFVCNRGHRWDIKERVR
jgi:hypothetical protein